jgi:Rod binding domain-containing protein
MNSSTPILPVSGQLQPKPLAEAKPVKPDPQGAELRRLRRAVADFEGLFLAHMLKSMQNTVGSDKGGLDAGGNVLQEVGWEKVAESLARKGGLGLGELLYEALEPRLKMEAADTALSKSASDESPPPHTGEETTE